MSTRPLQDTMPGQMDARTDKRVKPGGMGQPRSRVDGRLKVTGQARYAADETVPHPAFAFIKTSAIAKGKITEIDTTKAMAVPGVLDILTYKNVGEQGYKNLGFMGAGGAASTSMFPLQTVDIRHDGEAVAMVLADSYESAREAAHLIEVRYQEMAPSATFDSAGTEEVALKDLQDSHEDPEVGDAHAAYTSGDVTLDQRYGTPTQHHNPIELYSTTCHWEGDQLTVYEPSQFMKALQHDAAKMMDVDPRNVRAVSRFVGGGFGGKAIPTPRTGLVALAAKRLRRPVKLVLTRDQGYTMTTYRAETKHRVRMAAGKDGKLQSLILDGWEVTARPDIYTVGGTESTTRLYACPNVASSVNVVKADRNTPGFMRSPPEVPYLFPLECAMDEMAEQLGLDPVEFRRRNDTQKEPIKGLPFTSRSLMSCYDQAAKAFGWDRRNPTPRSMQDGDWLIGYGCATTLYPSQLCPASARVTLNADGSARVQSAIHDVGTGAYTVLAALVADELGVAIDNIRVEIGDSDLPTGAIAGGSVTTASVSMAVTMACADIRKRLATAATADGLLKEQNPDDLMLFDGMLGIPDGIQEPLHKVIERMGSGVEAYAEYVPEGLEKSAMAKMGRGQMSMSGGSNFKDKIAYAYGAEFVEVRVHKRTGEVRVPRVVGAFAAGTIINPKTAISQLSGGLIWGISSALHEETEIDEKRARYTNDNLAEYLIPVNADIGEVEVILVPEYDDQVNPLGIKGLGELGNVGTNAAVANAVYHATRQRIRELPVRIEKLLSHV